MANSKNMKPIAVFMFLNDVPEIFMPNTQLYMARKRKNVVAKLSGVTLIFILFYFFRYDFLVPGFPCLLLGFDFALAASNFLC